MLPTLSRNEVEARIAEGDILVIRHGYALRLNSWMSRHPGGDKAILHMVGRDASDEMDVYHEERTLKQMNAFRVGKVDVPWQNFVPPIQGGKFRTRNEIKEGVAESQDNPTTARDYNGDLDQAKAQVIDEYLDEQLKFDLDKYPSLDTPTQENIRSKFRQLFDELEQEGWFQCNYWGYFREFCRISSFFTLAFYLFSKRDESSWWLFLSAIFLGLAWHQLTFIAHDAGHIAITHHYMFDNFVGMFIASYLGGLSLGWWKRNHNVHHIVTNDPVHDPDIQHLPFFAVSSRLFGNIYSTYYERMLPFDRASQVLLKLQHYLYYPILCFGRFNLYRLSWEHILLGLGPRKGKAAVFRWVDWADCASLPTGIST